MGIRIPSASRASSPLLFAAAAAAVASVTWLPQPAAATDIEGVLPGALDQPRVNALVRRTPTGNPLTAEGVTFNPDKPWEFTFNAFLDTGASGHLLSNETAGFQDTDLSDGDDSEPGLGIVRDTFNGQPIVFEDVGGGGTVQFNVSEQLHLQLASHNQNTALSIPDDPDFRPQFSDFGPVSGPVRAQIGPVVRPPFGDPLQNLDVIGMPAMLGKVVVMDGRGLNQFATTQDLNDFDVLDTFIYNPGTPFNPADAAVPQQSVNPGIPNVDRRIALSYADFDAYSETTPEGAPGPTLAHNPFVGRDPVRLAAGTPQPDVPGVKIGFGGATSEGNWLFDTGAGASFISRAQAQALGVQYAPGRGPGDPLPEPGADPLLVDGNGNEIPDQFSISIAAFGGDDPNDPSDSSAITISGFYLDSMLLRTMEGNAANDADPNHLNFISAPVLVFDISIFRDLPGGGTEQLTLDGILGMNYFAASAIPVGSIFDPFVTAPGAFDWLVYDEANGTFGVTLVPEPSSFAAAALAAGALLGMARRCRHRRENA
jgi:hypothetical protein